MNENIFVEHTCGERDSCYNFSSVYVGVCISPDLSGP